MLLNIAFRTEFELTEREKSQIAELLALCFPDIEYAGRIYFKQMPHYRILAEMQGQIIGQLAIDFRAMQLNGEYIHVMGIADLAVYPEFQGQGMGRRLMQEVGLLANRHNRQIDFLYLVTDKPAFYERLGFIQTRQEVSWLKINAGKTLGIGKETVDDCALMYKPVSGKVWKDGSLDLLGYWY